MEEGIRIKHKYNKINLDNHTIDLEEYNVRSNNLNNLRVSGIFLSEGAGTGYVLANLVKKFLNKLRSVSNRPAWATKEVHCVVLHYCSPNSQAHSLAGTLGNDLLDRKHYPHLQKVIRFARPTNFSKVIGIDQHTGKFLFSPYKLPKSCYMAIHGLEPVFQDSAGVSKFVLSSSNNFDPDIHNTDRKLHIDNSPPPH